ELSAQHLGERRGMALAVIERARQHGDGAVLLEADAAIFLARRPGDLEILADAAAAQLVARRALLFAPVEALPVGRDQRLVEHRAKLARIVVHARWRLVRHLPGLDVVAPPQLDPVDAHLTRRRLDQPL